ncbi:GNAT family N-acetyltransferase [Streptomyces sp. NPDC052396]|uniref:GNAT family N-acetyltransferase n=1 Tax=Streptomyces sp. NPDC052396 TaxID=3365689 RepID=UPI0037CFAB6A
MTPTSPTSPISPASPNSPASPATWTVTRRPVHDPASAALLRDYLVDVADRWYVLHHGRTCTPEEIERHLAEDPSDDLDPPRGVLLVAEYEGRAAGCAGLRWLDPETSEAPETAEVKRMFIRPEWRGLGGGTALLDALEAVARGWRARRLVLDTRQDLVQARALYARHGFMDIPPYRTGRYSEVWLGKELDLDKGLDTAQG